MSRGTEVRRVVVSPRTGEPFSLLRAMVRSIGPVRAAITRRTDHDESVYFAALYGPLVIAPRG